PGHVVGVPQRDLPGEQAAGLVDGKGQELPGEVALRVGNLVGRVRRQRSPEEQRPQQRQQQHGGEVGAEGPGQQPVLSLMEQFTQPVHVSLHRMLPGWRMMIRSHGLTRNLVSRTASSGSGSPRGPRRPRRCNSPASLNQYTTTCTLYT